MNGSRRVFLLESKVRLSKQRCENLNRQWERVTKGTDIEGSQLIAIDAGRLLELTGDGLPKVVIDTEGNVAMTESESCQEVEPIQAAA